jgi:NAD(P)-dependent dehydrogenase (short-subunit alcohol dehydrogenase family)
MPRLNGKDILITGVSQGLGRQLAVTFAREGAASLSLIAHHLAPLQKIADEIGKTSKTINVLAALADVGRVV